MTADLLPCPREVIARIIDPDAFARLDALVADRAAFRQALLIREIEPLIGPALAKADAILSALSSEPDDYKRGYREGWNDREDDLIAGVNRVSPLSSEPGAGGGIEGASRADLLGEEPDGSFASDSACQLEDDGGPDECPACWLDIVPEHCGSRHCPKRPTPRLGPPDATDLFDAFEAALVEGTPTLALQQGRIWIDGETAFDARTLLAALSSGEPTPAVAVAKQGASVLSAPDEKDTTLVEREVEFEAVLAILTRFQWEVQQPEHGEEWSPDTTRENTASRILSAIRPDGGEKGRAIGRNITFSPFDPEVGNAVISPDEPITGAYWTLIAQGGEDCQNAVAAEIVRRLNAPGGEG